MKFLCTIAAFATLATAIPASSSRLEARLKPGQVVEPCQKGGYVWETTNTGGGWTCSAGLNHRGECVFYTWTKTPPYYSCIGDAPA